MKTPDRRGFESFGLWLAATACAALWGPILAVLVALLLEGSAWQLLAMCGAVALWVGWLVVPWAWRRHRLRTAFPGDRATQRWVAAVMSGQRVVFEDAGLGRPSRGPVPTVPRIVEFRDDRVGPALLVRLPSGTVTPGDMEAATDRLASALSSPVEIRPIDPRTVEIVGLWRDPLADGGAVMSGDRAGSSYEAVPIGVDELGSVVCVPLLEASVLVGGVPGSGKSGVLASYLAGVAQLCNVAVCGIDLKRVELAAWRARFSALAVDPDAASSLLAGLVGEMQRRYGWLEKVGRRRIVADDLRPDLPLVVLVIDELSELLAAGDKRGEAERAVLLRRLVALGRAAAIVVVDATQKPSADVVPTSFRDLHRYRIAMRTTTREMTATIVGAGLEVTAPAHELPDRAGLGYLVGEGESGARRFRSWWLSDDEIAELVASCAHLRVELPWLSTPAAGVG